MKKLVLAVCLMYSAALLFAGDEEFLETYSNTHSLSVDTDVFQVNIEGSSGDQVEVYITYPDDSKYKINVDKRGNRLEIEAKRKRSLFSFLFSIRSDDAIIDIRVPKDVSLKVESTSGDVSVQRIWTDNIEITTVSGDIGLESSKGETRLRSTSGSIEVQELVGSINVSSTSGELDLLAIKGDIHGSTTSGEIIIDTVEGNLDFSTTSGSIELDLTKGAYRIKTVSGDIYGSNVQVTDDSVFKTTSGRVTIDLETDFSLLEFDLSSVSGDLTIGDEERDDDFETGHGSIKISASSTSGNISFQQ